MLTSLNYVYNSAKMGMVFQQKLKKVWNNSEGFYYSSLLKNFIWMFFQEDVTIVSTNGLIIFTTEQ